jgi:hypothetical protein
MHRCDDERLPSAEPSQDRVMQIVDDPTWRDRFTLSADAVTSAERTALARSALAGQLFRVLQGAYVDSASRADLSPDERYRHLIHARHLVSMRPLVFSHASAAALWGVPRIGAWPAEVHVASSLTTTRTGRRFVQHIGPPVSSTCEIDGVMVTSLARTLIDLARFESMSDAVAAIDAGLAGIRVGGRTHHVTRQDLVDELMVVGTGRGSRSARFAVDFADARSGSPGESLSRLSIARAGLTPPTLQQRFVDDEGAMFTDFWWPQFGIAGEFDGLGKYRREEWMNGRSAAEVVVAEKVREDRLRRQVSGVVRWGWDVAGAPGLLGRLLRQAGIR